MMILRGSNQTIKVIPHRATDAPVVLENVFPRIPSAEIQALKLSLADSADASGEGMQQLRVLLQRRKGQVFHSVCFVQFHLIQHAVLLLLYSTATVKVADFPPLAAGEIIAYGVFQ